MSKKIFITGIPTAGKTFICNKLAEHIGGICIHIDDIRQELSTEKEKYKKLTNFYWDIDEKEYFQNNDYEKQCDDFVKQSEGLWPGILKKIDKYNNSNVPIIFEGVNILPHLAHQNLKIPGIIIISNSKEETLKRIIDKPRWGKTRELQELEVESYFEAKIPYYKKEAKKYKYKIFNSSEEAWGAALELLS